MIDINSIEQQSFRKWEGVRHTKCARDNLVDVRFNKHFLENIPNISLILYPKVGHMPPMEIPEIIAEDIKNFIVN